MDQGRAGILHVFGRMVRGGAEMRTLEVVRHLNRNNFRFHFLALSGLPGELDSEVRQLGGKVSYIPLGPRFPWQFGELLRREKIAIVHSHVHLFSGFILALAGYHGVTGRIAHFRSMHDGSRRTVRKRIQNRLMTHLIDRYASRILAVSRGAMAAAWNPNWEKDSRCEVLYNGLDLACFRAAAERESVRREFGLSAASRLCIHVGRMVEAKNHPRLLEIFRLLPEQVADCFLLLVGRGNEGETQRLRELVASHGLTGRVLFAGERTDVARLLKASDLMIFPSLREGLPGAVLEAAAAGLPVLASDLPGVLEIQANLQAKIVALPLQETDAVWAEAAVGLLGPPRPLFIDPEVLFANTPFDLRRTSERLSQIWGNY